MPNSSSVIYRAARKLGWEAVCRAIRAVLPALALVLLGAGCGPLAGSPQLIKGQEPSFKACPQFFAGGRPPAVAIAGKLRELCFDSFAVLHSGETKTPVYVAERLNREIVLRAERVERRDRFYADARLPTAERADLTDYRGSGFARGHMAPAADMPTEQAMEQSFSLANMVPQDPKQNSGPWAKVEEDTRKYALRAKGDIYVITGPVFADERVIGRNQVRVPSHLFKLVHDPATGRTWVHWQQNVPDAAVNQPMTSIELLRRVGLELLPGVRPH